MCTEVNSTMGLQATAATKRKHDITFDSKDNTTYTTNCPPPIKAGKWSMNNNNYSEAIEDQMNNTGKMLPRCNHSSNNHKQGTKNECAIINNNNNNNNNNNENKSCAISCNNNNKGGNKSTKATNAANNTNDHGNKSQQAPAGHAINSLVSTMIPAAAEVAATTPLPPTSLTPVPEDSIAKLEVVAAVPCEPWANTAPEPVDCISKLQAVAVPCDPWGSISTRSTLATTLLSTDELDDDDDDFEDDYEEEESIIPTYCPVRYPAFQTPTSNAHQSAQRLGSYSPMHGYGTRPNYYSEPFPQQNCSRTGSPQHLRVPNGGANGFQQWQHSNSQFYMQQEGAYPPQPQQQQQQQTIRCAENGKSYMELGCSSPPPSPIPQPAASVIPPPPFASIHPVTGASLDVRHQLKRCCDGRGTWCNANKNCYKDIRLKIRNLSMFKLSRFRQVSEQSLYRSVLICNTLKRIDREIEAEAKEMHAAVAAQHHHQQQQQHQQQQSQYQLHHPPHHPLQHHPAHMLAHQHQQNHHNSSLQQQQQQQQQQSSLLHQHQQHHQQQQHLDYSPVMSCARLTSMDYQVQQIHQHPQQQQPNFAQHQQHQHQQQQQHQQQHAQHHYHNHPERMDSSAAPPCSAPMYLSSCQVQMQKAPAPACAITTTTTASNGFLLNSCDSAQNAPTPLHPYDHYPFRESHSGRATPFPCQSVISTPPSPPLLPQSLSPSPTASSPPAAVPQTTEACAAMNNNSNNNNSSNSNNNSNANNTNENIVSTVTTSPVTTTTTTSESSCSIAAESDCSYADDDSTRSINWSSVLSLSSQSALDPLNNNDLFAILPPASSLTNPATAVPVSLPTSTVTSAASAAATTQSSQVAISGTFTAVHSPSETTSCTLSSNSSSITTPLTSPTFSTTATFTTLSTISSATHSLTSSYVNSMSSHAAVSPTSASTWEYSFLEMDFGLGTEFTELVPSCKLSSDELFKSSLTPVGATARYDNDLEQPAHIMVGS